MTKAIRFLAPILGILCAAGSARAEEDGADSYRAEMASASASAIGLFVLGDALERSSSRIGDTMLAVGAIGYVLVGSAVHAHHGNHGRALGSIGFRLGIPLTVGALAAATTAHCTPDEILCGLDALGKGMAVGAVLASVLDTALMSGPSDGRPGRDTGEAPEGEDARLPQPRTTTGSTMPTLSPSLVATSNLAFVGVSGRF